MTDRPAAVPPPMSRAAKAEALLLHFTAEAHRRKWNYDRGLDGDGVPVKSEAFDALHRLGEEMRVALEELRRTPAAVSVPPPATQADDRADLRDRIRRALCEASGNGFMWGTDMLEPDEYGDVADAVLAVLPPTADRAAVIAATARACAEHLRDTYSDMWTADAARSLELHAARIERGEPTALLHRMADKAQQQPDTETQPATCAECDHPHAAHREGDDPVSPGQCSACPDDDAWHDYQADEWPGGGSR